MKASNRDKPKMGVIGAGAMGAVFARKLRALGHFVTIASSKGPENLTALARPLDVRAGTVVDVVNDSEVVFLAIPTRAVPLLPTGLFARVASERVVVDVGNYHPELRDGRIDALDRGMLDSQWVSEQIGLPVVKAFNSILAESLSERGAPRGTPGRIALPVAGDSSLAKACVLELVEALGFDAVDAGDSNESFRQQPGAPAYCRDLDAVALKRALSEADRNRIGQYRAEREAQLRSLMQARR